MSPIEGSASPATLTPMPEIGLPENIAPSGRTSDSHNAPELNEGLLVSV